MKSGWLFRTDASWVNFIVRVALGIVILPHGAQKLLGMFGGYGFSATMGYLTGTVGLPAAIAFLVIIAEFFGSLGVILGFLTRIAAFGIFCVMLGATITTHLQHGFFMNWSGTQGGEGFEFHILAMGIALPLILFGAGRFSVDAWIAQKRGAGHSSPAV